MCDGICGGAFCSTSCEHFDTEDGVCLYSDEEERMQQYIEEEAILDRLDKLVLAKHQPVRS